MTLRHQVLLGGLDDDTARRLVLQLAQFNIEFMRVPWTGTLSRVLAVTQFRVIVLSRRVEDASLEEVVREIRSPTSPNRSAGVVLLVEESQLRHARRFVGRGVGRVRSLQDSAESWSTAVLELLDTPPRFPLRAAVRATTDSEAGPIEASGRTENVSMSGMLVRCAERIPVGSVVSFSLSLGGGEDPIRGSARVARAADPSREGVEGVGAAFVSFVATDRSRLRAALERLTA